MSNQLAPSPVFRATDNLGFPLYLGQLGTFAAGTSTPQTTYKDPTLAAPNTNPIILNARGEAVIWLDPTKAYKFVLSDALGNLLWTVDNITIGNANPTYNIIPGADNLYTLGNTSFSWANVYVGPNHAPVLAASGNIGYYTRTPAEIALAVTPTDFSYPADPYVDPRRYGADPTGVADSTTAVQTALNVAYQAAGAVWIGNACKFLVGTLSLTMANNHSIRIIGSSTIGSILQAKAGLSATSILTLRAAVLGSAPQELHSVLENFTIQGPIAGITSGVHGLSLLSVANFRISNVRIAGFDRGIDAQGMLTVVIDQSCNISLNNVGINVLFAGLGVTNNLLRITDCQFNSNSQQAISYNGGTGLYVSRCDIEANGTTGVLSTGGIVVGGQCSPDLLEGHVVIDRCWFEGNKGWTINVAAQTNGCALRTTITSCEILGGEAGREILISGSQFAHLEDLQSGTPGTGVQTFSSFTGGSGYVNGNYTNVPLTGGAGSGAQANISVTGGAVSNITIVAPGTGYVVGNVLSASNANLGGSGSGFTLTVGTLSADTYNITAANATLVDVFPAVLIDSGITTPWYVNVANGTLGGKLSNGRYDTFTGTLTGVTGTVTGTVQVVQQGGEISLILPDLTGTSNTTACTITGLPAKYQTTALWFMPMIVEDNGVDNMYQGVMGGGNPAGTILLYKNGSQTGFTNSGSKGVRRQMVKYRLDL